MFLLTSDRFRPLRDAPGKKPHKSALLIEDFIVRNMQIEIAATIVRFKSAGYLNKFSKIIIHVVMFTLMHPYAIFVFSSFVFWIILTNANCIKYCYCVQK